MLNRVPLVFAKELRQWNLVTRIISIVKCKPQKLITSEFQIIRVMNKLLKLKTLLNLRMALNSSDLRNSTL